jgi:hypothetical protein
MFKLKLKFMQRRFMETAMKVNRANHLQNSATDIGEK